jgi:AmmeMemoRadiSam system protein B
MILASAFDGSFYPAERDALEEVVDLFLSRAPAAPAGRPVGALVPHAGYVYSGRTAGMAVGALRGAAVDAVAVLAPSHRVPVHGCRVFQVEGFETPLGRVPGATALADALLDALGPQAKGATFSEHAIEVQLPLLQRALPGVPVVAVAFGLPDLSQARKVAQALAGLAQDRRLLVVASSDLSHYYNHGQAVQLDAHFKQVLLEGDPDAMARALDRGEVEACGAGAVLTLMALAQQAGAHFTVVDATDSSEAFGDTDRVVGYLSALAMAGAGS